LPLFHSHDYKEEHVHHLPLRSLTFGQYLRFLIGQKGSASVSVVVVVGPMKFADIENYKYVSLIFLCNPIFTYLSNILE